MGNKTNFREKKSYIRLLLDDQTEAAVWSRNEVNTKLEQR
jgi:hypothetical protein